MDLTDREKELVAAVTGAVMFSIEPLVSRLVEESIDAISRRHAFMVSRKITDPAKFDAAWVKAKTEHPEAPFDARLELAHKEYARV